MPAPSSSAPSRLLSTAAEQASRWTHIATTILRAGVVPLPNLRGSMAELAPLARYGTTLGGLYAMAAAAAPDRTALVDDDRSTTYGALADAVAALAHGMATHHGVGEGSAVGLLARNHIGFVEVLLACSRLGAHTILLNTGMSPAQAATVAQQQQLALIVADPDLLAMLDGAPADIPRLVCGSLVAEGAAGCTADLIADGGTRTAAPSEDGRTVVMTSGTTGAPKGARRPASGGPDAAASILSRIPLRAEETTHIAPPLFHTWGFANLQLAAMLRSTVVLRRRFEPADVLRVLSVHRCTAMAVVPVMLQRIVDLPPEDRPAGIDTAALRIVASSGSALPGGLAARWMDAFGDTLYNLYGSTEVSWATIATPAELRALPGTAGRAPRGTRLAILDDDGRALPPGETGRIFVGNTLLFDGYAGPLEGHTGDVPGKEVIDGLMATGDVGWVDEAGLLHVAGRDDDMIVSGGENVFPKEVEDLLAAREDVIEAAVIAVDDEEFGQRLVAFVVARDPDSPPSEEDLKTHVKQHLASFSVPRQVMAVGELPRNPTGKVVARELRDLLRDGS